MTTAISLPLENLISLFFLFYKHLNFYLTFKVDFHFLDEWRDRFVSFLAYPAKKVCKKLVDLAGI